MPEAVATAYNSLNAYEQKEVLDFIHFIIYRRNGEYGKSTENSNFNTALDDTCIETAKRSKDNFLNLIGKVELDSSYIEQMRMESLI